MSAGEVCKHVHENQKHTSLIIEQLSSIVNVQRLMPVFMDDTASRLSSCSASIYNLNNTPKQSLQKPTAGIISNTHALCLLFLLNFLCVFCNTVMFTAITVRLRNRGQVFWFIQIQAVTRDIYGSTLEAFWTSPSVLLASAISQPLWTVLSDILTQARLLTGAVALLTLGSSLALLADSFWSLLAAHTVHGVGIGGVVALTDVIILDCAASPEISTLFGVINSARALASALGPLAGVILPEYIRWRWLFWVNLLLVPFTVLAVPLMPRCVAAETPADMRDVVC